MCTDGACVCPNSATPNYCGVAGCVDTATDVNNCGTCGNGCTLAQVCQGSSCVCPPGSPQDFCPNVGCVDLQKDAKNCGTCGTVCAADKVCSQGACVCPQGKTECGGACVDPQNDSANCAMCGKGCATAQACRTGTCGCVSFGLTVCGDQCADLHTSTSHCGTCNKACRSGERCSSGSCVCDSGVVCDGECKSTTDNANCGMCGKACPTGQYCSGGGCLCQGFGLTPCGDACVSLSSDEANCGVCGRACPSGQSCTGGSCYCPSGQTYCEEANGCVNLTTNASYCGTCTNACRPTELCSSGICRCSTASNPYQIFCPSINACVDASTSTDHCGACDRRCNPTESCALGSCRCPSGLQQYCASQNACTDTYSNNQHCGACDRACPAGTRCSAGTCVCEQAGQTLCDTTCYDLMSDPRHCGTCTNSCPGNYTCSSGQCKCPDPTVGTPVRLTNNSIDEWAPVAVWDGTHVGVAYAQRTGGGSANVRFALLNPNGSLVSDQAVTTYLLDAMRSRPGLAWSGTEYAVVSDYFSQDVMFQRLDAAGATKGSPIDVGNGESFPQNPAVAWSASYAGYSVAFYASSQLHFRRVGADASVLDPVNTVSGLGVSSGRDLVLRVAPNGAWTVATGGSFDISLTTFNPDGSRTLAPQTLASSVSSSSGGPDLVHDGTNWLTTWINSGFTSVVVNRGSTANNPANVVTATNLGEAVLSMVDGTIAVAWLQRPSTSGSYALRLQRFAIPSTATSALTSIHNAVDVLPTQNTGVNDIALVSTGDALVAIWADNRWGATREIYAAPINLQSCP